MTWCTKESIDINSKLFNKVINADCRKVLDTLPDNSIDLIIADPPYLVSKERWDQKEAFTESVIKQLFRVLAPHGSIYVWCGIGEKSQSLIRWFPLLDRHFHFKDLITWKKQRGIGMRKGWLYTREEVLWFVKDNSQFVWNKEFQCGNERRKRDGGKDIIIPSQSKGYKAKSLFKRLTNVWTDIPEESFNVCKDKIHFAPKPEKAITRIIQVHTKEGDVILDPFLGSGTTAVCAKKLKRDWIGIEIDPIISKLAQKRIDGQ